ncbi:MAG: hypothetical protein ACT4N8_12905 [Sphingosinicella sp.]
MRREEAWEAIKSAPSRWYVYTMWRFDRGSPVPFYVGKGRGYRAMHHELPSKGGRNPHKQRIIDRHMAQGMWIGYSLSFYVSERSAFRAERRLIASFGRRRSGTGVLANLTDGGEGTAGHIGLRGNTNPRARAIVADGEPFTYVGAAARRLGVDTTVIIHRIRNGWPGYYYQDEGQRPQKAGITQRYRKEISVLGTVYPSLSEAAQATGMGFRMIAARVTRGWEGYLYVADGPRPRREKGRRSDNVAVIVRGERFPSIAIAAAATGESVAKIGKRCGSSNFPDYLFEDPTRLKEEKTKPPVEPVPVMISGRRYDSLGEAGRQHGLTEGGVAYRCASGAFPDWSFVDATRNAAEAFEPQFSSNPKTVWINGVDYPSQSAAARSEGIDINTLKKRCVSTSFPGYVSADPQLQKRLPKDGRPGLLQVMIEGVTYRSVSAAARSLGLQRIEVRRRCGSADWPRWNLESTASQEP